MMVLSREPTRSVGERWEYAGRWGILQGLGDIPLHWAEFERDCEALSLAAHALWRAQWIIRGPIKMGGAWGPIETLEVHDKRTNPESIKGDVRERTSKRGMPTKGETGAYQLGVRFSCDVEAMRARIARKESEHVKKTFRP